MKSDKSYFQRMMIRILIQSTCSMGMASMRARCLRLSSRILAGRISHWRLLGSQLGQNAGTSLGILILAPLACFAAFNEIYRTKRNSCICIEITPHAAQKSPVPCILQQTGHMCVFKMSGLLLWHVENHRFPAPELCLWFPEVCIIQGRMSFHALTPQA